MVKEIEDSLADWAMELGAWGACGGGRSSGISAAGAVLEESGAIVGVVAGGSLVLLAIASPNPAKTDIGSENSANQCSPVSQLNSSRLT